jgi:hypothetical protein
LPNLKFEICIRNDTKQEKPDILADAKKVHKVFHDCGPYELAVELG